MPEGDPEHEDDGLPEDVEEDEDEEPSCPKPSDVMRGPTESL